MSPDPDYKAQSNLIRLQLKMEDMQNTLRAILFITWAFIAIWGTVYLQRFPLEKSDLQAISFAAASVLYGLLSWALFQTKEVKP